MNLVEHRARFVAAARGGQGLDQPERANDESH